MSRWRTVRQLTARNIGIAASMDLSPLVSLEWLDVRANSLTEVVGLRDLSSLERLFLSGNQIRDFGPLQDLPRLSWIVVAENPGLDLAPLRSLTALRDVHVDAAQSQASSGTIDYLREAGGLVLVDAAEPRSFFLAPPSESARPRR